MIKKMNYQDGTVFILHPVPSSTKKETLQEDKTKDEEQEVSLEDS